MHRRVAALAAAVLLVSATAACGDRSGASPPPTGPVGDLILATATRATTVKTLAFTLDVKIVDRSGRLVHLGGDGVVDNPRPLVTMNLNTQGLLAQEPFVRPMISDGRDLYLRVPDTTPPQLGTSAGSASTPPAWAGRPGGSSTGWPGGSGPTTPGPTWPCSPGRPAVSPRRARRTSGASPSGGSPSTSTSPGRGRPLPPPSGSRWRTW